MNVTYFYRQKGVSFSIERVFAQIRRNLPPDIRQREFFCAYNNHKDPRTYWRNARDARIAARNSDINHITGSVYYLGCVLPAEKTVLTIHDLGSGYNTSTLKARILRELLYKRPLSHAGRIVAISEFTRRQILQFTHTNPKKIAVIHNPAPEDFLYTPKPFDADKPRILCFSHLSSKNFQRHIRALNGIRCHLRVIGRISPEDASLLRQNGVEFSNAQNLSDAQIVAEYHACDMLLFASIYEGFGVPILEAQQTGRPIVTSHAGALEEVVGDSAEIADPFDVASIHNAVARVIESKTLREEIIGRGLENIKRFDPKRTSEAYRSLYYDMRG